MRQIKGLAHHGRHIVRAELIGRQAQQTGGARVTRAAGHWQGGHLIVGQMRHTQPKPQVKMGKSMPRLAPRIAPIAGQGRINRGRIFAPFRSRPAKRAAQQSLVGAALDHPIAICAPPDIGDAEPGGFGLFRGLFRQFGGDALQTRLTGGGPGADAAGRIAWRADGRPQIHHRLGIVAGAFIGGQCIGQIGQLGLGAGQGIGHRMHPRHHPFDIAIHHNGALVKGDGGNGGGCIGANARQGAQPGQIAGKISTQIMGHNAGTFQQVARPCVVPQTRPFGHDLIIRGRRQSRHIRPKRCEPFEIATHGGDGGLLQHHLGQPDPIGIGPTIGPAT